MKDLIDNKFGRLTVIKKAEPHITPNGTKFKQWLCKCECGNEIIVNHYSLVRGLTKSCGCLNRELVIKRNIESKKKYNQYDLSGEYGIGYTSKGEEFYFDLDDYDKIKDFTWYINSDGYVCCYNNRNTTKMHCLIIETSNDIDHKNHCKNDNRKSNLRETTRSQNQMNCSIKSNNKSGVTGVCYEKSSNKWLAYIMINRKSIKLGRFILFDDAIKARKEAEEKYFGEYSYENSIIGG